MNCRLRNGRAVHYLEARPVFGEGLSSARLSVDQRQPVIVGMMLLPGWLHEAFGEHSVTGVSLRDDI